MKIFREIIFGVLGLAVILLASCSAAATGAPTALPVETEAPGAVTPPAEAEPTDLPQVVTLAQDWLGEQLAIPAESVEVVSIAPMEWTDSCLGLGGPAESCLQVITPGWQMVFEVDGEVYRVRSDQTGMALRHEGQISSGGPYPGPTDSAYPGPAATSDPAYPGPGVIQVTPGGVSPYPGPGGSTGDGTLEGSVWNLVSMGPPDSQQPALAGPPVTLQLSPADMRAGGNASCNSYSGQYSLNGDQLTFGQIASTMMACAEQARMDQETRYLQALQDAERYEIVDGRLLIYFNDDLGVLTFEAS